MRKISKNIQTKWVSGLLAIKQELETKEISNLSDLVNKNNMHRYWSTWLIKNNVVIRLNGIYHWSEKIPVSAKLINKFRVDSNNRQAKYDLKHKEKKANEKNISIKKVASPKIKNKPIQTNKNEVGIIRKFLKWLW